MREYRSIEMAIMSDHPQALRVEKILRIYEENKKKKIFIYKPTYIMNYIEKTIKI